MSAALVLAAAAGLAVAAAPDTARAQDRLPDGVRVIVNPATPVSALPREQVSRLFLRKVARWDGGPAVQPVDLAEASPARDAFSRYVHRRSVAMITGYWQRQIFSGRQLPPPAESSEAAVVAFVRATPGAVGYVSAAADVRGVRVVAVTAE